MSTPTTGNTNIFGELGQVVLSAVFPPIFTVLNAADADLQANPQEYVNPATAAIKGQQLLANLIGALPSIENAGIPAVATVIGAALAVIEAKVTAASAVTAASVGTSIGNTIISKT